MMQPFSIGIILVEKAVVSLLSNNNHMKQTITFLTLLLLSLQAFTQDIILKKNDEMLKCKIKEIGLDEVKYVLPAYSQDILFSMDKDEISKVIFENGEVLTFQQAMTNPANYADNKKNILKIEFLSPLSGNTTFAWEHSLRPGRSIEATFGIAGLGIDPNNKNKGGAFGKFGYKFIKSPDFYLRGLRYAHLLKGSYVKPELSMGLVSQDFDNYNYYSSSIYYTRERVTLFAGALTVAVGKQWVFDNAFSLDAHVGLGYGFSTSDNSVWGDTYNSGFIVGDSNVPIAASIGLKIGILLK